MTDEIRDETRRRLAEIDSELADDEAEVERQMPDILKRMIEEADIASKHYDIVANDAITPRYAKKYRDEAEAHRAKSERLKNIKL